MRKVTKTLLFRWIFVGFAPFIQAENFPHPLSRQRIIVIALAPFTFECSKSACPSRPVRSVPFRIFRDFYQKDMRVAHLRMLTGVLKLDFWGSRKVPFTFGAFRSDICVRRVPCFDHLFRYFLREKFTFFPLALSTFQGEKLQKWCCS